MLRNTLNLATNVINTSIDLVDSAINTTDKSINCLNRLTQKNSPKIFITGNVNISREELIEILNKFALDNKYGTFDEVYIDPKTTIGTMVHILCKENGILCMPYEHKKKLFSKPEFTTALIIGSEEDYNSLIKYLLQHKIEVYIED